MSMLDRDQAERLLGSASQGFMILHAFLVLLYVLCHLPLMAVVNALCIAVGGVSLWLLARERYRGHMLAIYLSELAHLICSALFVGWSAGFQVPLVGLTMLVFFDEYMGRTVGLPYLKGLPVGLADLAVYLLLFQVRLHTPGSMTLPEDTLNLVQSVWGLLSFGLIVGGLYTVVRMTSYSERVLTNQAETDKLTGLYNRAGYDELCSHIDLKHTTLLLADGDKFKSVNDRYGHEVGDLVLKRIAKVLKQNFRVIDRVCRIGGDEFVVLMLNTEELEEQQISDKIRRINRELSSPPDKLPPVSISVGVAFGGEAEDWKELFNRADAALYQVKQAGGRDCRFCRQ